MGARMGGYLVVLINRAGLCGGQAMMRHLFPGDHQGALFPKGSGIEVKRAAQSIPVQYFDQADILLNTVVKAEGDRFFLSVPHGALPLTFPGPRPPGSL